MSIDKVLLFRSELLPKSEAFLVEQSRAMRRFEPVFAGVKRLPDGLLLHHAKSLVLSEGSSLKERLRRRAFVAMQYAPRFLETLAEQKPKLIHAHFAVDAALALPIQRRLEVPLVVTLHGYDVARNDEFLQRSAAGRIYLRRRAELWSSASRFLCISNYIRRRALGRGFPEEKLQVHYIGVDLEKFGLRLGEEKVSPIVLFAGRLVENKGCIYLVRAMAQVERQIPDAQLVVIGDGPLRLQLEAEARQRVRHYTFTGTLTHTEVRDWMRRAAVLVTPSVEVASGDAEGLGMVLCEAQAMGLPGIGFRGTGVEEALDHGRSGLLVASGDSTALAEAIRSVLTSRDLREHYAAAGRFHAESRFNLHRQTALLEQIYCELLPGS